MSEPVLSVQGLKTVFQTSKGEAAAVDDISFTLQKGEILGLVGESGSGKSVTSLSIMNLLPSSSARIAQGDIVFMGKHLTRLKESEIRLIRGNQIAMIFQEPMTSLNPVHTIGKQLQEALKAHRRMSVKETKEKTIDLLRTVGIPRPEQLVNEYPHKLSGGMRQRVMIAMGIACDPEVLIADEPTTALDVTIQAQILDMLKKLQQERNLSVLLITHDLGVVAEMCQRVIVMYAGQIVEEAPIRDIFLHPKHPYTIGLIESIPKLSEEKEELYSIPGQVPSVPGAIQGCRFAGRCYKAEPQCYESVPGLSPDEANPDHKYRCFFPVDGRDLK